MFSANSEFRLFQNHSMEVGRPHHDNNIFKTFKFHWTSILVGLSNVTGWFSYVEASRANAKSLHAPWPISAPTFRQGQSEHHIPAYPIRTRELSSRPSGQWRILTHFGASRLHARLTHNTLKSLSISISIKEIV